MVQDFELDEFYETLREFWAEAEGTEDPGTNEDEESEDVKEEPNGGVLAVGPYGFEGVEGVEGVEGEEEECPPEKKPSPPNDCSVVPPGSSTGKMEPPAAVVTKGAKVEEGEGPRTTPSPPATVESSKPSPETASMPPPSTVPNKLDRENVKKRMLELQLLVWFLVCCC